MTRHLVFGTGQIGRLVAEQLGTRGVDVVAVNRNGDGRIDGVRVVGGDATDSGWSMLFSLARYNTDGSLDTTCDSDGKVTTSMGGTSYGNVKGLAIQTDGKIVAGGSGTSGGTTPSCPAASTPMA